MVHNWGEKGTGRVWGLIKYAKNLLNYVFPQETSDCAVLFKMLLLAWKKGFVLGMEQQSYGSYAGMASVFNSFADLCHWF